MPSRCSAGDLPRSDRKWVRFDRGRVVPAVVTGRLAAIAAVDLVVIQLRRRAALAGRLAVPFAELDSIYHQHGWRPLTAEEFRQRVTALVAGDGWVIDGNYSMVRDLVWQRADTVVWFDLPRRTVMRQVLARTLRRTILRVELWNGNREPITGLFRLNPEHSIIRWAWTQHAKYHHRFSAAARDPRYAHLSFIRIGSREDARRLLRDDLGLTGMS